MESVSLTFAGESITGYRRKRAPSAPPTVNRRVSELAQAHCSDPYFSCLYARHNKIFVDKMITHLKFELSSLPKEAKGLDELLNPSQGILARDGRSGLFSYAKNHYQFSPAWIIRVFTKISQVFFEAVKSERIIVKPKPYHSTLPIVQDIAIAALRRLTFAKRLTLTEAAIGFQLINSFKQVSFPYHFTSQEELLDRIARVFDGSLYTILPDLFPTIFSRVEGSNSDIDEMDCVKFGFPRETVPNLVQNWEVTLCADRQLRLEMRLKTTNFIRTAFLNSGARIFPWLLKQVPYPPEIDLVPLKVLANYGFNLIASPKEGDLVLYLDDAHRTTHMATFVSGQTVRSRWDGQPELFHPIDGLPDELKGVNVAFFRYRPKEIENTLISWVSSATSQVASEREKNKIVPVLKSLYMNISRYLSQIADEKGLFSDLDEYFNEAKTRRLRETILERIKAAKAAPTPAEDLIRLQLDLTSCALFNEVFFTKM